MLCIQIDNSELEENIKQTYGSDEKSLANAFFDFIQTKKIKQDIGISIQQIDSGEAINLKETMDDIRKPYE